MANTFKSFPTAGVTTEATVFTGPASTQTTVIGMTVANVTTGNVTVSVVLDDGSTPVYLVKDATVVAGGALVPIGGDQKVVIESGDTLKVSGTGAVDVLVSVLEIS